MDHAARITEQLTPEQRRERLRAFADRMLIALGGIDDPETGDDVTKGVRTALMIERLYARCDASEAGAHKRAIDFIGDQVKLKNQLEWSGNWLSQPPEVSFVTLKPNALDGMQWPRPPRDYVGELKAEIQKLRTPQAPAPKPATPTSRLTAEQIALRERILNTAPLPRPDSTPQGEHDYGLFRDEDLEVMLGERLQGFYAKGSTREGMVQALKTFSLGQLKAYCPDLFALDTT